MMGMTGRLRCREQRLHQAGQEQIESHIVIGLNLEIFFNFRLELPPGDEAIIWRYVHVRQLGLPALGVQPLEPLLPALTNKVQAAGADHPEIWPRALAWQSQSGKLMRQRMEVTRSKSPNFA